MADKSIVDLTQATQITNDDLFVLQQGSEAKKLKGETLLDFVTLSVISVSVTTLPAGSQATASYSKSTGVLSLGIPQGDKGAKGDTGARGDTGAKGDPGPKGETGATGATGPTGPANTLGIGTVTSGTKASATITGTAPNQTLNLVLEKGDKGNPGADAPTISDVTIRQNDYHMIVTLSDGTSYDAGYCRGQAGAGTGDMLASVYDPQGKNTDIFKYIADEIAKIPTPDVSAQIKAHNESATAHQDIRDAIPTKTSQITNDSGYLTQHQDISGKLDKTGDGSNVTAAFTQASSRSNIATGEKLSVMFGKIKKWFADLGSLAFKSTVSKTDLASDVQTSLGKADTALQSAPVTSVNGKTGAVTVAVPTIPTTANLLKGDGSGGMSAATAGTDYTTPANVRTILNRTNNVSVANTSYTTYMARGEALFSAETTPTVNGCIAWQYE